MNILANFRAELAVRLVLWLLPMVVFSERSSAESRPAQLTPESMQSETRAAASTCRA